MGRTIEIEVVSALDAAREKVWRSISTMTGVNYELHPFVHMTSRREHQTLPTTVTPGQAVFQSWLLFLRVVPFDRHALALDSVNDGHGFVEESSSWLQRRWRHERTLTETATDGCILSDRLIVEPRLGPPRPIVAAIVRHLFAHRHRRLTRRFGAPPTRSTSPTEENRRP